MSCILVSGMMVGDPYQGGATWAVLQYILGLRRLGHDVWFVEPVPAGFEAYDYFRDVVGRFDLANRAALLRKGTREVIGVPLSRFPTPDIVLNISGMLAESELMNDAAVRVYLDLDPAFNQLWHSRGLDRHFSGHTHFVTIGLAIGTPDCAVPTCGVKWIPTLQPIVLEHWPVATDVWHSALTTVGNWRAYGSIEHDGTFYGQKAHSLRQFLALPKLTDEKFLLAMSIHQAEDKDLAALQENAWGLIDPATVANSTAKYQQFVQHSKAEFGIAKSGYVTSRCAWFSDRSVCYLASGRPVIAQDTGFSRFLPTGTGLFAFQTSHDVLNAIDAMRHDYARHSEAARALAEEHFDSDKILTQLLGRLS